MRLVFVADLRSPIARNWINLFIGRHETHLVSTRAAPPIPGAASSATYALDPAFERQHSGARGDRRGRLANGLITRVSQHQARHGLRRVTAPVVARARARALAAHLRGLEPDLVHALRIPYEGIFAERAVGPVPLVVSIWGNDLTLHAHANGIVRRDTARTLARVDGLLADCRRDLELATRFGWPGQGPEAVVPGSGGIDTSLFVPEGDDLRAALDLTPDDLVVLNARGVREYVRTNDFYRAMALLRQRLPRLRVVGVGERGDAGWQAAERAGIADICRFVSFLPFEDMPRLHRTADVSVSPTVHDGTPNTLLESMAAGRTIVAGDLASIREWIVDGQNGLLCDATNAADVADKVARALADEQLRARSRVQNPDIVLQRADVHRTPSMIDAFYAEVLSAGPAARHRVTKDG